MNYVPDTTIKEMFWTGTSRLNRLRYFKRNLALIGFFLVTFFAIVLAFFITAETDEFSQEVLLRHPTILIAIAVLQIFTIVVSYKLDVRRLKDLGRGKRLALIALVFSLVGSAFSTPIITMTCNIISGGISLFLLFAPGNNGPNAYGPDPLQPASI